MWLTGYDWKALLDILVHSETNMLVQLSERCDVQTRDFIFLFLLALIMYLLDISSELSLSEFLNQ